VTLTKAVYSVCAVQMEHLVNTEANKRMEFIACYAQKLMLNVRPKNLTFSICVLWLYTNGVR
jgi:hypothetical protein